MLWSLFCKSLFNNFGPDFSWEVWNETREGRVRKLLLFRQWIWVKPVWPRHFAYWPTYDLCYNQRETYEYPAIGLVTWTHFTGNTLFTETGERYCDNPVKELEALCFLWHQAAFKSLDRLSDEAFLKTTEFLGYFVVKPTVQGYRVKVPGSVYLSVWSARVAGMDNFYKALRDAGVELGISLPPEMVYELEC